MKPFVAFAFWALLWTAFGAELASLADIERAVDEIAKTEKPHVSVYGPVQKAVQRLPPEEQARLAAKYAESPHLTPRWLGFRILSDLPAKVAAPGLRRVLRGPDRDLRLRAAVHLLWGGNDADARAALIKEAADPDPKKAAEALYDLAYAKGPDVSQFLVKFLQDAQAPQEVRMQAVYAAGRAEAFECAPLLAAMLDDRSPVGGRADPGERVCDRAACALEQMYQINQTGTETHPIQLPVAERDAWIGLWKRWYAAEGKLPPGVCRANYAIRLLDEALDALRGSPDKEARAVLKKRLLAALGSTFCLGDLPGVDAVVGPNVRDLCRLLRVHKPEDWFKFRNSWESHAYVFEAEFLKKAKARPAGEPDGQAADFIAFAAGSANFPRVRVWAFSRDFAQAFPRSRHVARVREIQAELEEGFRAERNQVVVHGHAAVLEPVPQRFPSEGNCAPAYGQYLTERVLREPSNWALHRVAVDYAATARRQGEVVGPDYAMFRELSERFPGNEWPFLANAAYQLRVRGEPRKAAEFADKALVLNPDNAKGYAIRGILRMTAGADAAALLDLDQVFKLDPRSLADEPETPQAVAFLIRGARPAAEARAYEKALGGLTAPRIEHPIPEYRALLERRPSP